MSVAAQSPASNAYSQEIAPEKAKATAMALPRAAGDAVYLFAPFLLGLISDIDLPQGTECAVAGVVGIFGIISLNLKER
jgi:MFS-type transporter involved in bile tolerance (Atg22 family)